MVLISASFYNINRVFASLLAITYAILCSKFEKASDKDGVLAEIYKMCLPVVFELFHSLSSVDSGDR